MAASAVLGLCSCGRLGYGELAAMKDAGPRAIEPKPDARVEIRVDAGSVLADAGSVQADAGEPDAGRCPARRALDFCEQLPELPDEPVLDGELDCGPQLRDLPQRGWTGTGALPAEQRARYAVAWRPNGLYFFVEVDDPERRPAPASEGKPWCGDGVELYADADGRFTAPPAYDDPGTMQLLAAAPAPSDAVARAPDVRFHTRSEADVGEWSDARHGTWPRDGGYVLESFVTAEELALTELHLTAGGRVGIDVAIDVSVASAAGDQTGQADCGFRAGQYFLRVAAEPCASESCRPYTNVSAFCTPMLLR
jgi:hypothetical protein